MPPSPSRLAQAPAVADRAGAGRRALAGACFAVVALGALVACGHDGSEDAGFVELDGSPRRPDDAGVLTAIADDNSTITVDGELVYELHEQLQSFSSLDGSTQPLRGRLGQYVHLGLDGDTVVWVAGIGAVARIEGRPQTVTYLGTIDAVDGRAIHLVDGTVFRLADGVDAPGALPAAAVLRIGVSDDEVVALEVADRVQQPG